MSYVRFICSRGLVGHTSCFVRGVARRASSSSSSSSEVELEKLVEEDLKGVAVIKMNRPHARNALGKTFLRQFAQHLNSLKHDRSVHIVVIRSLVAGVFCAGADLKERHKMTDGEVADFVAELRAFTSTLYDLPVPTIAALDGVALGGGLEMASACDLRVSSTTAKMGLIETTLAIIPGAGGTQYVPRIVGPSAAKELILTGRVVDGEEARRMGLVNEAVVQNERGDAAYERALAIARQMAHNGPIALRMAKFAVNKGIEAELYTGLAIERACYAQVIPTKDRREGLLAFQEKRKPRYKGE